MIVVTHLECTTCSRLLCKAEIVRLQVHHCLVLIYKSRGKKSCLGRQAVCIEAMHNHMLKCYDADFHDFEICAVCTELQVHQDTTVIQNDSLTF